MVTPLLPEAAYSSASLEASPDPFPALLIFSGYASASLSQSEGSKLKTGFEVQSHLCCIRRTITALALLATLLGWAEGVTCHPIPCPMEKVPLQTPCLPSQECLPEGRGSLEYGVLPWAVLAYFGDTTTCHAEPVPPNSLLSCLPCVQDSHTFPPSRWMIFWMEESMSSWIQQIPFFLHPHPARAVLCRAQLCSFHDSRYFNNY